MKPTAILLNCARGKIVDQVALHAALRDGQIAFAGIDVTEVEPVASEDPILTLPNIYVTPPPSRLFADIPRGVRPETGRKRQLRVDRAGAARFNQPRCDPKPSPCNELAMGDVGRTCQTSRRVCRSR